MKPFIFLAIIVIVVLVMYYKSEPMKDYMISVNPKKVIYGTTVDECQVALNAEKGDDGRIVATHYGGVCTIGTIRDPRDYYAVKTRDECKSIASRFGRAGLMSVPEHGPIVCGLVGGKKIGGTVLVKSSPPSTPSPPPSTPPVKPSSPQPSSPSPSPQPSSPSPSPPSNQPPSSRPRPAPPVE